MYNSNSEEGRQKEQVDLESRLGAFYGPKLREQPLPQSTWLRVQANLGSQHSPKHAHLQTIMRRRNLWSKRVPGYIQNAYSRVLHEARMKGPPPTLRCSLKPLTRVPSVHNAFPGKRTIQLVLPPNTGDSLQPAELNVLLATGLARYSFTRKLEYWLPRLLLLVVFAFACVALFLFAAYHYPAFPFLIAILMCAVVAVLVHIQRRKMVFQADELMVRWLGRSRVCQGLHILADRSRTRQRRGVWGEPSLAQRIERVCGTRAEVENDRLTLVR
ncbi:MAG TPA: hypothetical protein VF043_24520 [Ktedonobacteraceae bacterium]